MSVDLIIEAVVNNLRSQHYNFSNDWINGCAEFFCSKNPNPSIAELQRFILDQWKLSDLREMETKCLPANLLNERKTLLPGKYALQVEAMLDISVSCYSQHQKLLNLTLNEGEEHPNGQFKEPKANRMWQLTLCDGTQVVKGLEHETIRLLDQPLIPGTKVLIMGPVLCRKGQLMLTERNIKVLGGEIDSLIVPNTYENILCQKLGLPMNPNPYNENLALPNANVAPLPNARPAPSNNNLPPLLPAPPPNDHRNEHRQAYSDDNLRDAHPSFSDDDDLIDAAVDAQLLALEQQHNTSTGREARLQDEFEQQCHDNSDIMNLSEDEDMLQSFDIEEIERRAMGRSSSMHTTHQNVANRRNSSNEASPSMNTGHQSFQNPPVNRLPSNQAQPNHPTICQPSNQVLQNHPTIRQSSNQAFQNQPTVRQSGNQPFQNHPTVRQTGNQAFQNQPTVRQSSDQAFQNQSTVRQPIPSSQSKSNKPVSPGATKQTKLTSFLKLSKPGERRPTSASPRNSTALDKPSSCEPVIPKPSSVSNSQKANSLSDWMASKGKPAASPQRRPGSSSEAGTSARSGRLAARLGFVEAMVCGPDDEMDVDCVDPARMDDPTGEEVAQTRHVRDVLQIDGRPYVYLVQLERLPPVSGTVYTVKAFVMTVVSKVSINKEGWHLVAKICDGSAVLEVVFSSDVVESLIGFSHQEVKAMRSEMSRNPNLKEKLVKAFEKAQHALINLNCLMEVEFHGNASLPSVIALIEVTETHFAALHKRLDSV